MTNETIFKYRLEVTGHQTVMMPKGARILNAYIQDSTPCLWAMVDRTVEKVPFHIDIYGTGNPYHRPIGGHKYINTVGGNGFVWHIFQRVPGDQLWL